MRICLCLLLMLLPAVSFAQRRPLGPSGKVGERVSSFQAVKAAGPPAEMANGNQIAYSDYYGGRPTAVVFTKRAGDEVVALVKALDEAVGKDETKQLAAYVVFVGKDKDSSEELARKVIDAATPIHVGIVFPAGREQVGAFRTFGVSATADATLAVTVNGKIFSRFSGAPSPSVIQRFIENLEASNPKASAAKKAKANVADTAKDAAPPAIPAADLIAQMLVEVPELEKLLSNQSTFDQSAVAFQRRANGLVAVVITLVKDETNHPLKAASKEVLPAAVRLAQAKDFQQATESMQQMRKALPLTTSSAAEPGWVEIVAIKPLMRRASELDLQLARHLDDPKTAADAARIASTLAAYFRALGHDTKKVPDPNYISKWEGFCEDCEAALLELSAVCRSDDRDLMFDAYSAVNDSCTNCHKVFRH